ncbi:exodeoxyribonuclease VII large subunit [Peptostreptococcus stomatis]|uniref:exodeoxyribonuclease VII large subunit n=1 Tax=Peptostreptococcus stomatis TaxID=341694 RepID=UPI001A5D1F46|nr:exodeoxyribonuclease VII large subunit [Peptostreptococcus stomatis]MBL6466324.1 exodeoxyribonuclease VII large subunit [Peptostreptococcus stomatis]
MKIRVLEVSEVNEYIKKVFLDDPILNSVKVRGEISNFKIHSSGHVYLTLKDNKSKIRCMIYRSDYNKDLELDNGSKIVADGYISNYVSDGSYQLYMKNVSLEGVGNLYLDFLKLKEKLDKEGLFSNYYKKPIPRFPKSIGVVTSETGAVIRDIINVISRRYPKVAIKLYPALVQGKDSVSSLIAGINFFNLEYPVDTIIIGRGGGSLEELWSFNDEDLARAIFASSIPVISAVGHETDFTICDFVSDERAPTPSAAAEIATPNLADLLREQDLMAKRMTNSINNRIILEKHRLRSSMDRFSQYADRYMLGDRYIALDMILDKIDSSFTKYIQKKREEMNLYGVKMSSLNPFSIFDRGYSIAEKEGRIVSTIRDIDQGDKLKINLKDGKLDCQVVDIEANDK